MRGPGPRSRWSPISIVSRREGWTREPFTPTIEGNRLYGRGSGDAKASVAAMLCAARDLAARRGSGAVASWSSSATARRPGTPRCRGGGAGRAHRRRRRGRADQSRVRHRAARTDDGGPGRPGRQRHAGYAADDGELPTPWSRSPGPRAARRPLRRPAHPVLGHTTATPTMLEAGVSRNVTPPVARAILDVRSTPDWTHDEVADVLRRALHVEVVVTSRPAGALRDTAGLPPARAGGVPARGSPVRQSHLLRLGFPPRPRRGQVRPRHQPALAHA